MFRRLTNKVCLAGLVAVSVLSLWGGTRLASAQSSGWQAGLQQMARLQSLIEYYYMVAVY